LDLHGLSSAAAGWMAQSQKHRPQLGAGPHRVPEPRETDAPKGGFGGKKPNRLVNRWKL
jgi:hypothetical protein